MEKLVKRAQIWFVLGVLSVFSAVAGTPLFALAMLKGWYVAAVPIGILTAHGFYGIPLYFSANYRARVDISCIKAVVSLGGATVTDIASATGLTDKAAESRAHKCVSRGYLTATESDGATVFACTETE